MSMSNREKLKLALGTDEGEKQFKYLSNKHRGGKANAKGNSFENHFAVHQIAKYLNKEADHNDTTFSTQIEAFVDDFLIRHSTDDYECYHQLKDVERLSWTSGEHPIKDDFLLQYALSQTSGIQPALKLVVSKKRY